MASTSMKGTRKTYSFEEREILMNLINKYDAVEDRKSDPTSMCKRKSAWAQLAEEYNSMVGPEGTRSAVQLRRCWENMKACKRNREERSSRDRTRVVGPSWENCNSNQTSTETPSSSGNIGLPPNVVFEPKASEPFTLQGVSAPKTSKLGIKKEMPLRDSGCPDSLNSSSFLSGLLQQPEEGSSGKQFIVISDPFGNNRESSSSVGPRDDCSDRLITDRESSVEDNQGEKEELARKKLINSRTYPTDVMISPQILQGKTRRSTKSSQREEELHVLALSEAQMKVDIAVMQKEEIRVKLEEAHYRKEEARLRMLFFTYKLDRIKED
ncbi:myb/SANT-like DNA-binding domain-containing protein 3 [Cephus cinctus]|uniref:Regulatory protein zeste n=1 Tax=Cephus cinctus TaxID=211228 RepID=A0AAJ7W0U6_CEPCN|nr:myb/SANT-like DNA-binding domain-containing protein 3 [Cephus cinctus]